MSSFRELISNNEDLAQLVRDKYAVGFDSHCLIVRDIPYLDAEGALKIGAIVTKMTPAGNHKVEQQNHQVFFAGSLPHDANSQPLDLANSGNPNVPLSPAAGDVKVERAFSIKPRKTGRYEDFHHKIETYVNIISGPARNKFPDITPFTSRLVEEVANDSVFLIQDAMMMLAGINDLADHFKGQVVGIIGLGGTGSYILDFMVKTHVDEIRGWDGDRMLVHNTFRSPGQFEEGEFGIPKADVYSARYANLRRGIVIENVYIDEGTGDRLDGLTFAFVCVDSGSARKEIFDLLVARKIPFIDVGMGLVRPRGALEGHIRTTLFPPDRAQEIREKNVAPETDAEDHEYKDNIQIAELNALNACIAVIRYKQLIGFYFEEGVNDNILFEPHGIRVCLPREQDVVEEDDD